MSTTSCGCNCGGKCKLLGGLEQKIMDVLWSSSSPLKPSEVLSLIGGNYAYTTIMTVLKRLHDKKIVLRHKQGSAFYYSPQKDKHAYASECLDDLFRRLFNYYGQNTFDSFVRVSKELGLTK